MANLAVASWRAVRVRRKRQAAAKNKKIKFKTGRSALNTRVVAAHNAAAERTQFARARRRRRYLDAAINRASQATGARKKYIGDDQIRINVF